jgi:DNA repair protein RecO (recombination protein O)
MYSVNTTEGFILKSRPFGEANKYFYIYTEQFGLIVASARSVRELKSKLRYHLRDFSYGSFSLVRGKEHWRLTNGFLISDFSLEFSNQPAAFQTLVRVFSLVRRLAPAEEANGKLFSHLRSACLFFQTAGLETATLHSFECLLALRILESLGYLGDSRDWQRFVEYPVWSHEILGLMKSTRAKAVLAINHSIKESQL